MHVRDFRQRVRRGEEVIGTFIKLPGLDAVDLAAAAGFDFAAIDLEHSQLSWPQTSDALRHAATAGFPMMVRLPSIEPGLINRLLEAGAAGIQVSNLQSRHQREALISACRYPPDGGRSASSAQPAAAYGAVPLALYLADEAKDPPLLVGQIETAETDSSLDAILPGLDVAFLGTTDLSVDLGAPGELDDPRIVARVAEVLAAARQARVASGAWVPDGAAMASLRAAGARYFLVGSDLAMLRRAMTDVVEEVKGAR